eukprot:CAMPEP_0204379768 /NCGR_PEP_ID=MMETSP0469-20131031/52843_1 /ASSEMBLY_ACC=CAM_ASM_000384 /TAXON_ID=2969 /ORGANISM="Oxyrrhis marina" /LENGTH=40 /DNA_ID= /DNA_START= /DNA_END= /DNA_ORIENTATION=
MPTKKRSAANHSNDGAAADASPKPISITLLSTKAFLRPTL